MGAAQTIDLAEDYNILNVGIALYNPDAGVIVDSNQRMKSLMGYSLDELRKMSVERYTANTYPLSGDDFVDRLQACISGPPQEFTWRIKRGDGELIWTRIRLSEYPADNQRYAFAEVRDVSEYYRMSDRAELFWRLIRHNLRNEATVINGYATHILDETESEGLQEAAETIRSKATELGGIAESVTEIEHAVALAEDDLTARNARDAVEEVISKVENEYPSAEITLNEREEMWVQIASPFTHALTHAIENAIVHSNDEVPLVEVEIGPSPNTGRVDIQISDRNPPIRNEEINGLYDRTETTDMAHGSGVGLFVMKWCIESMGGELGFERRTPEGNTVHVYLPSKQPDESSDSNSSLPR